MDMRTEVGTGFDDGKEINLVKALNNLILITFYVYIQRTLVVAK